MERLTASSLMIGDWVQDLSPVVIDAISNNDICTYRCKDGYITANPSNLKPLPLTAEILENNGFVPAANGVSWYLRDDDTDECLLMLNKIHNAFVMSSAGMTIGFQYVHQLQHLLRLCGIKKEIEL